MNRLKELIDKSGLTQTEIAARCFISRNTLHRIVLKQDFLVSNLIVICAELGVTPNELLGWENDEQN